MNIREHFASAASTIAFLVGIVWLYTNDNFEFWPGILLVLAASSIVEDLLNGEWVDALVAGFIFGGLFAWFTGRITAPAEIALPLGLISVGLILLLNVFRRTERSKAKRKNKRKIETEPTGRLADDEYDDILDLDTLYPKKQKNDHFYD